MHPRDDAEHLQLLQREPQVIERQAGSTRFPAALDTPAAVERYRALYPGGREATFEAYVDTFFRLSGARNFPGGWTNFSRCANAEPALVTNVPELVRLAEEHMRAGGYEADDRGRPIKGRRWVRQQR